MPSWVCKTAMISLPKDLPKAITEEMLKVYEDAVYRRDKGDEEQQKMADTVLAHMTYVVECLGITSEGDAEDEGEDKGDVEEEDAAEAVEDAKDAG